MRSLLLLPILALAACSTTDPQPGSYNLPAGLVTYDAMLKAKQDCAEAGGVVQPIDVGGDPNRMNNYRCVVPPKGQVQ